MPGGWQQRRFSGAIIGLIALYAVLLQGALTAAAPAALLAPLGILCAAHDLDAPAGGPPDHGDHACCTLAQVGTLVPPTLADAPAPSFRRLAVVPRRPEAAIPRTGPPTHAHSARGPPPA